MDLSGTQDRAARVVWLSGLSGAGKSTLAEAFSERLAHLGIPAIRLDGDELRAGLCRDLGFSAACRAENLRRAAEVARLLCDQGTMVVCSFVTPLNHDRGCIREILQQRLLEVFVDTSLAECERRDPKGLYRRARSGDLPQFTGISSPFEVPDRTDLTLLTECRGVPEMVEEMMQLVSFASIPKGLVAAN